MKRLLRCPVCRSPLASTADRYQCTHPDCAAAYPIIDGIAVLINEHSSVFSIDDFVHRRDTYFSLSPEEGFVTFVKSRIPDVAANTQARRNYRRLAELLLSTSDRPRVLVVGGSVIGQGMEVLLNHHAIEVVETDISFGTRTMLICDAHDIPFADETFDGVVAQAVLEHVADPYRCVEEMHRTLKRSGLVYAETPFMYQVHGGRYDFTRFTHLGHRRLFRKFDEICSGAVSGPASALALAYEYFLLSFVASRALRIFLRGFARISAFWLKYLDGYLSHKPGIFDAATGYYFVGSKSERPIPDRELVNLYRGAMQ